METQGRGSVTYNVRVGFRMTRHGNSRKRLCNIQCESRIEDGKVWKLTDDALFLVLSYVYSKQPILGLTQEWFRELSFSRLECGVHKLHISSADWWDLLLPLA